MNILTEIQKHKEEKDYYSAEFRLNQPRVFYQFKIRKSISEPMFAVVKEGSMALETIKEGEIINMRYYYLDKSIPSESKDTRIKYVTKNTNLGFKGHYIVGLDIYSEDELIVA